MFMYLIRFGLSRERCTRSAEEQTKGAEVKHTRLSSLTVEASVWVCSQNLSLGGETHLSTHKGEADRSSIFHGDYTSSVYSIGSH